MCDPEIRKNCATLKESLMDIDSNFDDDYKSINALNLNNKKKNKDSEIKSQKKVTFDCADENLSAEETFDYDHEDKNMSDEGSFEDLEDENISDEEYFSDNSKTKFDYDHEEDFDYDTEEIAFNEDCSNNQLDKDLSDNDCNTKKKIKNTKEDIYGRIINSDSTIVSNLY